MSGFSQSSQGVHPTGLLIYPNGPALLGGEELQIQWQFFYYDEGGRENMPY